MISSTLLEKFQIFIRDNQGDFDSLVRQSPDLANALSLFLYDLGSSVGNRYISSLSIFEALSEGVALLDEKGLVTYCNPTFLKMVDKRQTEILGEDLFKVIAPNQSDLPLTFSSNRLWIAQGNGDRRPVLLRRAPLKSYSGVTMGTVVTIIDISDQVEKESILKEARDRAILLSNKKSNFLATVSHEIRTPINGVLSLATLLGMYENIPSDMKEDIDDLTLSAKSLALTINSVLDFSKLEVDKISPDPRLTSLPMLIQDIEVEHRALFKNKNQYFFVHAEEGLPSKVKIDSLRVKQVVSNLLSNANKFTAKDGCIMLFIRMQKDNATCPVMEISVADTGIGISEDKIEGIFESYSQLDDSITRSYGGTGLGLAICKGLSELLGGNIEIKSRPGIGSIFKFKFPLEIVDSELEKLGSGTHITFDSPCVDKKKKVLAVDDNKINLLTLTRLLQANGHLVVAVNDPLKVEDIINKNEFDIILTDLHMPNMSGLELAESLKSKLGTKMPPIIAVSADNSAEYAKGDDSIFSDFLLKPIDFVGLFKALDSL